MKLQIRIILLLLGMILIMAPAVRAVKAMPGLITIRQPDGSTLAIRLYGDERSHYSTTGDGYLVIQNRKGFYCYGTTAGQAVVAGERIARDNGQRSDDDKRYLKSIDTKQLLARYKSMPVKSALRSEAIPLGKRLMLKEQNPAAQSGRMLAKAQSPDTLHELVILANFSDTVYVTPNPGQAFSNLFNQHDYNNNGGTGSVRDYYYDNSMGNLVFDFTVVGPVTLPHPMAFYGKNTGGTQGNDTLPGQMVYDACVKAHALPNINFSRFDNDGDGVVDNVFVVYAGVNEAEGGAASTLWPSRWSLSDNNITPLYYDGVTIDGYDISSELQRSSNGSRRMAPIGTFCHEFGHALGLPDFYDTDTSTGTEAGGTSTWDLMDYGNYNNNGCTPPFLTSIERWMLGWMTPAMLTEPVSVTLNPLGTSNYACRLNMPVANEFYLFENRQQSSWDKYLNGHGMLIYHVDMTDLAPWQNNTINTNSSHQYANLVEADNNEKSNTIAGDPFPGTSGKTSFTDASYPYIFSWYSSSKIGKPVTNITENLSSSTITFDFCGGNAGFYAPPVALQAGMVRDTSFVANWNPVSSSDAVTYYVDVYNKGSITETEDFASLISMAVPDGWSGNPASSTVTYSDAPCAALLTKTGDAVVSKTYSASATSLSFWAMADGGSATLKVEGYDGKTWTEISSLAINETSKTYTFDSSTTPPLPDGYSQFRFANASANNGIRIFLDDVATAHEGTVPISRFTNINAGSGSAIRIHPVTKGITYYYVVRASSPSLNPIYTSPNSNEISVVPMAVQVLAESDGKVKIITTSDTNRVEAYTATGQKVADISVGKGVYLLNRLPRHTFYIIRVNEQSFKVVTP
jgi:M6 family metalloprotease-like protein